MATDLERIDLIGGPRTMSHYPRGWAMASNTPFRLYKRNTHAGGHQVPCLMRVGNALDADVTPGLRRQYAHCVDVWPTVAALCGVDQPTQRAGVPAKAPDGVALTGMLTDPDHPEVRHEQLYELAGHRGLYLDGWEVVTRRSGPGPFHDGEWELYHLAVDPTEIDDLAATDPERVAALSTRWDELARAGAVYPLDEGSQWRWIVRRPADTVHDAPLELVAGTPSLDHWRSSRLLWHRNCRVTIEVDHGDGDAGVLVSHGDQGGGYVVWVEGRRVRLAHNDGHGALVELDGGDLPRGRHVVGLDIGAPGGWRQSFALSVDGVERDRVDDLPMLFPLAPFEGITVGRDPRSPVHWDLHERHGSFPYGGRILWVRYEPGERAPDHPSSFEELTRRIGMAYE